MDIKEEVKTLREQIEYHSNLISDEEIAQKAQ